MICFLRCASVNEDVRLRKYIEAAKKREVSFLAITWDRLGISVREEYEIQFTKKSPYGLRWKNLGNKILWQFFVFYKLVKLKSKYKVIHATNFENVFPALLMRLFFKKPVIYDIYDSASSDFSNSFLTKILRKLDLFAIKKSDLLILADKKRLNQINIDESHYKFFFDVENVPNYSETAIPTQSLDFSKIKLSYVGVFDPMRGLEELMDFIDKNENFILNIAGAGTLIDLVKIKSKNQERITYHGSVHYEKGIEIMRQSDFIIGMYHKKASNHIYAAPNKFFEALYLAKPLITTKGTLVGDKTESFKTGYAIDETENDIETFFNNFQKEKNNSIKEYELIIRNAANLWNSNYSNYFEKRLVNEYINLIISINE
jgi:glycosyltransferase involved in cell wall biosynthesis